MTIPSLRVVVVPRWGGGPASDFYPWLVEVLSPTHDVEVLTMPNPNAPTLEAWVPVVLSALGDEAAAASTILVGHSVGCMASMHALAMEGAPRVRALLGVAGWFSVDEPWASIRPWIDADLDTATVQAHAGRVEVIVSDNDPFTADGLATAARFRQALGATVTLMSGAAHFNRSEEPGALAAIRAL